MLKSVGNVNYVGHILIIIETFEKEVLQSTNKTIDWLYDLPCRMMNYFEANGCDIFQFVFLLY